MLPGSRFSRTIDLSVSPSPRTQTSQWQSSISCTGSGTRTSLCFSAIEKHWKIRSLPWFYGVYASKMHKQCAWGTCNTDSRYPERMAISFILLHFLNDFQTKQSKMSQSIQPQYKLRQKRKFSGCNKPETIKVIKSSSRMLMSFCALLQTLDGCFKVDSE